MNRRLEAWVAPHEIRWYGPGEHCDDALDADVLIVDHGGAWANVLTGTAWTMSVFRRSLRPFAWCDHNAFARWIDGQLVSSEMGWRGHERRPLEHYADRLYAVVSFHVPDEDRARVAAADDRCAKIRYGVAQYPPLALDGFTGLAISASAGDGLECAAHVALCGWNVYWTLDRNPLACAPWDVAAAVDAAHAREK